MGKFSENFRYDAAVRTACRDASSALCAAEQTKGDRDVFQCLKKNRKKLGKFPNPSFVDLIDGLDGRRRASSPSTCKSALFQYEQHMRGSIQFQSQLKKWCAGDIASHCDAAQESGVEGSVIVCLQKANGSSQLSSRCREELRTYEVEASKVRGACFCRARMLLDPKPY